MDLLLEQQAYRTSVHAGDFVGFGLYLVIDAILRQPCLEA
jgi:hypothetical protein